MSGQSLTPMFFFFMNKRNRRIGSVKNELLSKSREAALAAVQLFNNPTFCFKSEAYIVLMIIAWTYLLHAYYRKERIEYRYYVQGKKRRVFHRTKKGAYKYWELERCINEKKSPLDSNTANNLRFLIEIRHEIEHQMTTRIDDCLSAKFQACCLNFNEYIKRLFGSEHGIESHLTFSLQFSGIDEIQKQILEEHPSLPKNIKACIADFEQNLSESERADPRYAYRVLFVPTNVNHPGQADKVIQFIPADSPLAVGVNKDYAVVKDREKEKLLPSQIVKMMHQEGFLGFRMHEHTQLVKQLKSRIPQYGAKVAHDKWYWYSSWLEIVRKHCQKYASLYTSGKHPVFPLKDPVM